MTLPTEAEDLMRAAAGDAFDARSVSPVKAKDAKTNVMAKFLALGIRREAIHDYSMNKTEGPLNAIMDILTTDDASVPWFGVTSTRAAPVVHCPWCGYANLARMGVRLCDGCGQSVNPPEDAFERALAQFYADSGEVLIELFKRVADRKEVT